MAGRVLARLGEDAEVVLTGGAGHAAELSRGFVARHFDLVVGWGGDGTINEVAGPLIGTTSALGIVPSGSGDGLARSLSLVRPAEAALAAALRGPSAPIDVGFFGARHFLNIAGAGFDAAVAHGFNRRGKRGAFGYFSRGLSIVWTYRCERYHLRLGDEASSADRFLVAFANGSQYGNGLMLAPDADVQDGWLNAVVVDGGPPLRQFWRARRLLFRKLRPAEGLHRHRVQHATIAGDTFLCHVDGETFDARGTLEVRIEPNALRVSGVQA